SSCVHWRATGRSRMRGRSRSWAGVRPISERRSSARSPICARKTHGAWRRARSRRARNRLDPAFRPHTGELMSDSLRVALISEVFFDENSGEPAPNALGGLETAPKALGALERLTQHLREARRQGAELAVLPEIPLNPWSPATRD